MRKLLCILALLAVAGCKKTPADIGPVGANTFFCQIDGQDFTPYLPPVILGGVPKALSAGRISAKGGLVVDARNSLNKLEFYLATVQAPGTYQLGYARNPTPYGASPDNYGWYTSVPPFIPGVTDPRNLTPPTDYYTDAANTGTVTVTRFDTVAHVVGGTFAYTAREAATGKLVRITNGRFDVKLP